MRVWSLAARLTLWYGATAFLLVAIAAYLQYRTLVQSLEQEDDQLLLERLAATPGAYTPASAGAKASLPEESEPKGSAPAVIVRELTAECLPARPAGSGLLPPPSCPGAGKTPEFRTWVSPRGDRWRILTGRTTANTPGSLLQWREISLNRSKDVLVLRAYRARVATVLLATFLLAGALGYGLTRRGLAPLSALAERVAAVDASSLGQRLGTPDAPTEIRALVRSFDVMLGRLEAAFASLTDFASHLAHEFRTPIHVLRQQAEVVLRRTRSAEEYRDTLASSLEEFDRLQRMVDDILLLARTEDPRTVLQRESFPVQRELAEVAEFFDASAAEGSVTLQIEGEPFDLVADRMLVRRALVNLLSNAIRHTPVGGRVRLSAYKAGHSAVIEVSDTGEGIAADHVSHVFERHYRVRGSKAGSDGSGLGLPIVRGIMQAHGGAATFISVVGKGTTVRLSFVNVP